MGAALPTEAEVDELRARLDGIRAMLDDADQRDPAGTARPPAPDRSPDRAPDRSPGPRRTLVALVAGAVVALLLVGYRSVTADGASPTGRPAAATGTASTAPVGPGRSGVPPVPPAPGTSARAVPSGLASSGPGVDEPGTDVVLAPASDLPGVLEVLERVVPADRGATVLRLTAPDPTRWTGVTVRTDLSVTAFEATSGGRPADVRAVPGGWEVTAAPGGPLGPVVLRYQVAGGTVRTPGADPGRLLMLLWPLSAEASQTAGAPVVVRPDRNAVTVRQMLCPLAEPALQLCGAASTAGWTGRIPAGAAAPLVVVQADVRTR
ncbi:hypothetical protein [Kineosporia sp. A_224]|uniref:hypothetical protein n=1 Tax=Kineosporia sp. A_224 TaxID=1962180 RepID=UPI00117AF8A8|nr:hypothetical protein [Kineosporia sp. A_224]